MPVRKYSIDPSAEKRDLLYSVVKTGASTTKIIMQANILLLFAVVNRLKVTPDGLSVSCPTNVWGLDSWNPFHI